MKKIRIITALLASLTLLALIAQDNKPQAGQAKTKEVFKAEPIPSTREKSGVVGYYRILKKDAAATVGMGSFEVKPSGQDYYFRFHLEIANLKDFDVEAMLDKDFNMKTASVALDEKGNISRKFALQMNEGNLKILSSSGKLDQVPLNNRPIVPVIWLLGMVQNGSLQKCISNDISDELTNIRNSTRPKLDARRIAASAKKAIDAAKRWLDGLDELAAKKTQLSISATEALKNIVTSPDSWLKELEAAKTPDDVMTAVAKFEEAFDKVRLEFEIFDWANINRAATPRFVRAWLNRVTLKRTKDYMGDDVTYLDVPISTAWSTEEYTLDRYGRVVEATLVLFPSMKVTLGASEKQIKDEIRPVMQDLPVNVFATRKQGPPSEKVTLPPSIQPVEPQQIKKKEDEKTDIKIPPEVPKPKVEFGPLVVALNEYYEQAIKCLKEKKTDEESVQDLKRIIRDFMNKYQEIVSKNPPQEITQEIEAKKKEVEGVLPKLVEIVEKEVQEKIAAVKKELADKNPGNAKALIDVVKKLMGNKLLLNSSNIDKMLIELGNIEIEITRLENEALLQARQYEIAGVATKKSTVSIPIKVNIPLCGVMIDTEVRLRDEISYIMSKSKDGSLSLLTVGDVIDKIGDGDVVIEEITPDTITIGFKGIKRVILYK